MKTRLHIIAGRRVQNAAIHARMHILPGKGTDTLGIRYRISSSEFHPDTLDRLACLIDHTDGVGNIQLLQLQYKGLPSGFKGKCHILVG